MWWLWCCGRRRRLRISSNPDLLKSKSTKPGTNPGFVLLIAPSGSYRITAYSLAAKSLGFAVLVVSNSRHSLVSEIATGITVDFTDLEKSFDLIITATKSLKIRCVLATDDSCVELCSRVAEHFNLAHNKPHAAELTRRKDLGRLALKIANCRTPDFRVINLRSIKSDIPVINYPVVAKPLTLSASRGVIRADNAEQLLAAYERIDRILAASGETGYSRNHILVESYLEGPEYAVEGFILKGQFQLLTIFDKPEPLIGPYFEETYYLTPTRLEEAQQDELVEEVRCCCDAYGLEQGPVHAEVRLTADGPVLLELASRTIGGQCGQLIEFSLRQKLEELVILGMCGIKPELAKCAQAAGVLMIPVTDAGILKRVEGLTKALQTNYVVDIEIHIREGYELVPLPEGASYLGFIFAQAPDYDLVYRALKSAYGELKFVTQQVWKLSPAD